MILRLLVLFTLAALLLTSCLGRKAVPEGASGAEIYVLQNCRLCHEEDGSGSGRGPALGQLRTNWTVEQLVSYLSDPAPFIEADPRLKKLEDTHSLPMPRYHNLTEQQRSRLAVWLLERFGG